MEYINNNEEIFLQTFYKELKEKYLSDIPVTIRKLLIEELNCKPIELRHMPKTTKPLHIRWECENMGTIFFQKFDINNVEIHILPTPSKKKITEKNEWYTLTNLKNELNQKLNSDFNKDPLWPRITYYEKPDLSNSCLKLKNLTWNESKTLIPILVNWTLDNQKQLRENSLQLNS